MSYMDIFMLIISLLGSDNAKPTVVEDPNVLLHLQTLAHEISEAPSRYHADLISLAYNESRFGYKFAYAGSKINSNGDCGVFQQRPKFAQGGKTTCNKLQDSKEAVKQAVAYLQYVEKRWGSHWIKVKVKGKTTKVNVVVCHYNSGNSCDDNKDKRLNRRDSSVRYAIKHNSIKKLVELKHLFDEIAVN